MITFGIIGKMALSLAGIMGCGVGVDFLFDILNKKNASKERESGIRKG
jgi:hypothetical protein